MRQERIPQTFMIHHKDTEFGNVRWTSSHCRMSFSPLDLSFFRSTCPQTWKFASSLNAILTTEIIQVLTRFEKKVSAQYIKKLFALGHYIFQQLVIANFKFQTISYNFVHWSIFWAACVFHFLGLQTKANRIPSYLLCPAIYRGLSSTPTNTISVTIKILSLSMDIIFCCSLLTP